MGSYVPFPGRKNYFICSGYNIIPDNTYKETLHAR